MGRWVARQRKMKAAPRGSWGAPQVAALEAHLTDDAGAVTSL